MTSSLIYSTYFGGSGEEEGAAIDVDSAGNAYLAGYTKSTDFPVVEALQETKGGEACSAPPCSDAFLARLSPSGSILQYSTYLGGSSEEYATSVAVDGQGNAYLTGYTLSDDFPTTPGAYDLTNDQLKIDAFVVKVSGPIQEGMQPDYNWHYEYDGLSRLVYACSAWDSGTSASLGESFGYEYDGAGNSLSFSRWSGSAVETVGFVYNSANQILCQDGNGNGVCGDPGDVAYTYDAYGNLTDDGVKTYVYDAENRLVSASDGVSTTSYAYNGDGDRISQTVDGILTSYVLDTAGFLTMVLAETTGSESIYYLHGLDLVAQHDGTSTEYFGYDGLGSVRQMLDGAGNVLFARVYDPYGNPFESAGTSSTGFGFTGEQEDENGLIFLRARYYEPYLTQFIQRDSILPNPYKIWEWNPYSYARNNPINFIDPSGKTSTTFAKFTKATDDAADWAQADILLIEEALWDTARAYSDAYNQELHYRIFQKCEKYIPFYLVTPTSAFLYIHAGRITFERHSDNFPYWGEAQSRNEIHFYANAQFTNKRFVVHEVGHTFERALEAVLGERKGRIGLTEDLWFRSYEVGGELYGGFAGAFGRWQWSRQEGALHQERNNEGELVWVDGRGEIFADMFIGWVYNQWEPGIGPNGWSPTGEKRAGYMNTNMPKWIFDTINRTRGWKWY